MVLNLRNLSESIDSQVIDMLINHLDYSFRDVDYNYLTLKEKYIVKESTFNKFIEFQSDPDRVSKIVSDKDIIDMMIDHFNYSIEDISSYDDLTDVEKSFISKDIFNLITWTIEDEIKSTVIEWNSRCEFTGMESNELINCLINIHKSMGDKIKYNREVLMATLDNIDNLCNKLGVSEPYYLPMYGMTLRRVDSKIESIIDEFNPKYAVSAGEDSLIQLIGYIQGDTTIYNYIDNHPEVKRVRGIGILPSLIRLSDSILEIEQAEICGNISICLLNSDYPLALLLSMDVSYKCGTNYLIDTAKNILTKYYKFNIE